MPAERKVHENQRRTERVKLTHSLKLILLTLKDSAHSYSGEHISSVDSTQHF